MIFMMFPHNLRYNLGDETFYNGDVSKTEVLRFLKGVYTNKPRFENNFVKDIRVEVTEELCNFLMDNYDSVEPYKYEEAFNLENREFQTEVFGSINITEMITELGHERIKTDGMQVKRKIFAPSGEFLHYKEYDNVYETHRVFGKKLGLEEDVYAVRCWCTSTNNEHWLWIEDEYKDDPLQAIASTFRIHKNVIPHIKELKRQGDIMLVEMNKEVEPEGEVVPLTKEQYFDLLTTET